jgi:arginyl-tRNA synthetase
MLKEAIRRALRESLEICEKKGLFPEEENLSIEIPKEKAHGDYSTNVAFLLSRKTGRPAREIAEAICQNLHPPPVLERVDVAGGGFINFYLKDEGVRECFYELYRKGIDAFLPSFGKGKKVLVEFVSANPTGPLHVGHARNAAFGDTLSNILEVCGFEVTREYYINDMGRQIRDLGTSMLLRWRELHGQDVEFDDRLYQGDYIKELARRIDEEEILLPGEEKERIEFLGRFAADLIMDGIKKDLEDFGCKFDQFYRESDLYRKGCVDRVLHLLKEKGMAYEKDGALFFRTGLFEEDEDRVLVKSDGETTYFASDIAYHKDKFDRGFDLLIDVWGADHHGYVPRIKASLEALGKDKEKLKILLIQFVTLLKDGRPLAMSTRRGEFRTLRELLFEVGKDAARFFLLTRKGDAHLEFDIDLAKRASNENPVYYVQYAHARIESVFRVAGEMGIDYSRGQDKNVDLLRLDEELEIMKGVFQFFDVLEGSARALEPHRLTFYLVELAQRFHSYYNGVRIIGPERDLTLSRLMLLDVLRETIKRGLHILGVSAPERM